MIGLLSWLFFTLDSKSFIVLSAKLGSFINFWTTIILHSKCSLLKWYYTLKCVGHNLRVPMIYADPKV